MEPSPKRSWWGRNWKWVVPVGCLTPLLCCGGVITLIIAFVFGAIKSSDVYVEALSQAKGNKDVVALLGEPIVAGAFPSGKIEIRNQGGNADLVIPLSGPKGTATIHAVATKNAGRWEYSKLEVVQDGAARIDLRPPPKE